MTTGQLAFRLTGIAVRQVRWTIFTVALLVPGAAAFGQAPSTASAEKGGHDLGDVAAQLANPVGNLWAIFTEFDLTFSGGDLNRGGEKVGGRMIFQPVLPIPLYGQGKEQWKLITRPTLPVIFSQPVPTGFDQFDNRSGLGDLQFPMVVSPPTGNWLLAAGPTFLLPTATSKQLGQQQWGVGPAVVVGYHTKDWTAGIFPQYTWGVGGWNGPDKPKASYGSLFYFFFYNLPDAWQIGFNPTITYSNTAPSGNKWNVPVGLAVSKTLNFGNTPVKVQLGVEYSVVSPDAFGQRAMIKLNLIPVIPGLIKSPLFQ